MRSFLIIANFMAPQAVLILLAVPLPILSSRYVFLNSPLHWITPATLCLFQSFFAVISDLLKSFALFNTGHETTALRLSFVLPSFHLWLFFVPAANSGPSFSHCVSFGLLYKRLVLV